MLRFRVSKSRQPSKSGIRHRFQRKPSPWGEGGKNLRFLTDEGSQRLAMQGFLTCCATLPVAVPGIRFASRCWLASCRPLPLAQFASSAAGGALFAPPLEYPYTLRGRVACLDGSIDLWQSVKNKFFDRLKNRFLDKNRLFFHE